MAMETTATPGSFRVPAGRRLSRMDSKALRASFSGNDLSGDEAQAVLRNMERKDTKIRYNRRMRIALVAGLGVMLIFVGAMFAVTLSANEASKESHVKGGALVGLDGESVKVDAVKSYGNILGFPCLPMNILETMDEVSLEVQVAKDVASDGILQVVLKVGTIERSETDAYVIIESPSGKNRLAVNHGKAMYIDTDSCVDGCDVIVEIDVSGRRLTSSSVTKIDRSLSASPPRALATFAIFNTFAQVFKEACEAFKTVGVMCDTIKDKDTDIILHTLCSDLKDQSLREHVKCEASTFTFHEIISATDVEAAWKKVFDRCHGVVDKVDDKARRLLGPRSAIRGRKTWGGLKKVAGNVLPWVPGFDYGWCSVAAGFLLGGSDTSNYCDKSQTCDSTWGCDEKSGIKGGWGVSQCCIGHDICLQADKNKAHLKTGECTTAGAAATKTNGGCCDIVLSRCARDASCWKPNGWIYSTDCATASGAIWATMAARPNQSWQQQGRHCN